MKKFLLLVSVMLLLLLSESHAQRLSVGIVGDTGNGINLGPAYGGLKLTFVGGQASFAVYPKGALQGVILDGHVEFGFMGRSLSSGYVTMDNGYLMNTGNPAGVPFSPAIGAGVRINAISFLVGKVFDVDGFYMTRGVSIEGYLYANAHKYVSQRVGDFLIIAPDGEQRTVFVTMTRDIGFEIEAEIELGSFGAVRFFVQKPFADFRILEGFFGTALSVNLFCSQR